MRKLLLSAVILLALAACNTDKNTELIVVSNKPTTELYTQLQEASSQGDLEKVRTLIKQGANVNQLVLDKEDNDRYQETPLMLASEKGHLEVVKELVAAGANVNQTLPVNTEREMFPGEDQTALEMACRPDNMEVVKTLAFAGTNAESVIVCACRRGDEELLQIALQKKPNLNFTTGEGGVSPLMMAAENGDENIVKALLKTGADPNYDPNEDGETALKAATAKNHSKIVELLKSYGAKDSSSTEHSKQIQEKEESEEECFYEVPLVQASEKGNIDEVNTLLASGVDVNAKKIDKRFELCITSLMVARNAEVVQALVAAGADINALNEKGDNALMFQAWFSPNAKVIKALIAAGADVNTKNKEGVTALRYATFPDGGYYADISKEVVKQILAAKADVNATDNEGTSTLMSVVYNIYYDETEYSSLEELINTLLEAGANVNASDKRGRTALMYAINAYNDSQTVRKKENLGPKYNLEKDVLKEIQILLTAGADVNTKDKDGHTALDMAQKTGNTKIVELLKQAGAKE